jgi:hypothetical protein
MRVYGPPLDDYVGQNGPEFPLLLQEDSRAVVPQLPFVCGNAQEDWVAKPPIHFFMRDSLGVKSSEALYGRIEGLNDRDKVPFDAACRGITIRIHVCLYDNRVSDNNSYFSQLPGYPSSTDVKRTLMHSGGGKAKTMQVREGGWKPKWIVS